MFKCPKCGEELENTVSYANAYKVEIKESSRTYIVIAPNCEEVEDMLKEFLHEPATVISLRLLGTAGLFMAVKGYERWREFIMGKKKEA